MTPFGADGDNSPRYPSPKETVDVDCSSDSSRAVFILIGEGQSLVNGLYPCRMHCKLLQETPAPVSNYPLIASGLKVAIGCWLGIIELSGRTLVK